LAADYVLIKCLNNTLLLLVSGDVHIHLPSESKFLIIKSECVLIANYAKIVKFVLENESYA